MEHISLCLAQNLALPLFTRLRLFSYPVWHREHPLMIFGNFPPVRGIVKKKVHLIRFVIFNLTFSH
jgi:hypothetical protein